VHHSEVASLGASEVASLGASEVSSLGASEAASSAHSHTFIQQQLYYLCYAARARAESSFDWPATVFSWIVAGYHRSPLLLEDPR